MRIKLDENLPATSATALRRLGHDVETVPDEGLTGRPDNEVWATAVAERRFLITQDLDFSDVRTFTPGTHSGILVVRPRAPGRLALMRLVMDLFEREDVDSWQGCFVVATDRKVRVRRP